MIKLTVAPLSRTFEIAFTWRFPESYVDIFRFCTTISRSFNHANLTLTAALLNGFCIKIMSWENAESERKYVSELYWSFNHFSLLLWKFCCYSICELEKTTIEFPYSILFIYFEFCIAHKIYWKQSISVEIY